MFCKQIKISACLLDEHMNTTHKKYNVYIKNYSKYYYLIIKIVLFYFLSWFFVWNHDNRSGISSNIRRNTMYTQRPSESQSPLLLGSRGSGGSNTSQSQLSFDSSISSDHPRYIYYVLTNSIRYLKNQIFSSITWIIIK
jgi:hypothetical protein